ncbi:MAG: molecular chaperone DnaK [Deltaproteobacteria bacterium]|nr:molecular chaperone DnaK [Deltaproteobacteria bacterium]
MGRVIGIDLGTTNSCVAVFEDGRPIVVPNSGGYKTTPSMFGVADDGKRLVGHLAKRQAITNARHTVFATKRLIGRRFDDTEAQRTLEFSPFEIVRGPNDDPRVRIGEKAFTCPEIAGIILRRMKRVAEEYLGEPVEEAVITVPAYFTDTQRQCTRDAGKIAGLEVLRIINEPTAAALAYGMTRHGDEKIAVYDLGGGTFDISILEMSSGVLEVLATAGNTFLGGEDLDRRIVTHLVQGFEKTAKIDLKGDAMALQRLKDAAEKAKCDLSVREVAEVNLPFITSSGGEPQHLNTEISRETLEDLVQDIVEETLKSVDECLADAGLSASEVNQVVIVGGQTRMPMVQEAVTRHFGRRPHKGVNPDEVVALGAVLHAHMLVEEEKELLLLDVTPLSLGISTFGGHFARLIERNTTVPVTKAHIFTTTRDDQSAVKIRVLQGESDLAEENDLLGEFILAGIPLAPKGEPEIEVSFDIDSSGMVSVSARDLATGSEQSIAVNSTSTLTSEELEQLVADHEAGEVRLKG